MSYKMIVSDLDGTMLDASFRICEKNAVSVKRAMEAGCVFVIASGRPAYSVLPIARELGMGANQFVICFNGALIAEADTGHIIYSLPLKTADALHIIKNAKGKGATVIAYIDGSPYTHQEDRETRGYTNQVGVNITVNNRFEDVYSGEFNKVIVRGDPKYLKMIEEDLSEWAVGRVTYVYSSPNLLEYFNNEASKGTAMLILAEKLGVNTDEIIAVGDYYNDLTMLEAAGLGVAIKNSPGPVIAAAGYVTEREAGDGAVSEIIERFIMASGKLT